jgi:hypothetical protein
MTEKQFRAQVRASAIKAAAARTPESRVAGGRKSWLTRKANALKSNPFPAWPGSNRAKALSKDK